MARNPEAAAAAALVYADLETPSSAPKDLLAVFCQSKVPLQRLFGARRLSAEIDEDALNTAAKLSNDLEWTVREAVAQRVPYLHANDEKKIEKAVSLLVALCRDQKIEVRLSAAISLARIPQKTRMATYVNLIRDKDPKVRCAGAECLGRLVGEINQEIINTFVMPELAALVRDDLNFSVRKTAGRALARICHDSVNHIPDGLQSMWRLIASETLLSLAVDSAWPCRRAAADSFPLVCGTKTYDASIATQLVALIDDDSSKWVRTAAQVSLGHFLAVSRLDSCPEALAAYANLPKSMDDNVRFSCAFYLPGVLVSVPEQSVARWNSHVKVVFENLVNDVVFRIRRSLAHSLHHIAAAIGPELAARDLLSSFESFLQDMDDEDEVKLGAVRGAAHFIAALPANKRDQAFELLDQSRAEFSSVPAASLASSRDARIALASQLSDFARIKPALSGVEKLFLALATDEAHLVREKALDSLGEIAPHLSSIDAIAAWLDSSFKSAHHWDRWAFARSAKSVLKSGNSTLMIFSSLDIPQRLETLKADPVLMVRTEAS